MIRQVLAALVISLSLLAPPAVFGEAPPMSFSIDLPAGQWKGIRLKGLPKDARISLAVQSDGPLSIGFLNREDRRRFPQLTHPLFWGQLETKLGFSVTIQQSGDYYVIFDNRNGAEPRRINLKAYATLAGAAAQALLAERLRKVEIQLKALELKLNQTFVFEPIPIRINTCKKYQTFDRSSGLTLCLEFAHQLLHTFQDKTQASDALVFSMFQEMARLFQSQWGLDSVEHDATLDELTTVLMLTFRLDANVRAYSQTVINQPLLTNSLLDLFDDSLHPLNVERAHRVLKWATDPDLVRRWQAQLVPHMQTSMLRHLTDHPQPWSDQILIKKELDRREYTPSENPPSIRSKDKIKASWSAPRY